MPMHVAWGGAVAVGALRTGSCSGVGTGTAVVGSCCCACAFALARATLYFMQRHTKTNVVQVMIPRTMTVPRQMATIAQAGRSPPHVL